MKRERENSENEEADEKDLKKCRHIDEEELYKKLDQALVKACEDGNADVVEILLENDAYVSASDKAGSTAIICAAKNGHVDVVKVLIQNGADVNDSDYRERTALHFAAQRGDVDVVKVLIQNGADVNAVDTECQFTALQYAAQHGHVDVAKVLIQNGADVNAVDEWKQTALHIAALEGHVDIVKVLLQNGADVNAVDISAKQTALDYSVHLTNVRCILQLLCFGAEINEKTIMADILGLGFIRPIYHRLTSLREGNGMETTLMSDEERRFMWNLAFFFTIKHGGATAFRSFTTIRSFITYHGIFMGPGYDRGEESVWRTTRKTLKEEHYARCTVRSTLE